MNRTSSDTTLVSEQSLPRLRLSLAALIATAMVGTVNAQPAPPVGRTFLAQKPPGMTAEVFAPALISKKDRHEFGSVFSGGGNEFYFGVDDQGRTEIWFTELKAGNWTAPARLLSHQSYSYNDPFLSPDETKLFFISDRPFDGIGAKKDIDLWYMERTAGGWSQPINAGKPVNSERDEYYVSFTASGAMYFASNGRGAKEAEPDFDIYRTQLTPNGFLEPTKISSVINSRQYESDACIAYDESYIIFCSYRPDSLGEGDLYISFRNPDLTWTQAKNMGRKINTAAHELCPFVTKDGRFFFYTSNKDIFWIDARFLNELR